MHICVSICYQMFLMVYNQGLYPANWVINPEGVGRREKGRVGAGDRREGFGGMGRGEGQLGCEVVGEGWMKTSFMRHLPGDSHQSAHLTPPVR